MRMRFDQFKGLSAFTFFVGVVLGFSEAFIYSHQDFQDPKFYSPGEVHYHTKCSTEPYGRPPTYGMYDPDAAYKPYDAEWSHSPEPGRRFPDTERHSLMTNFKRNPPQYFLGKPEGGHRVKNTFSYREAENDQKAGLRTFFGVSQPFENPKESLRPNYESQTMNQYYSPPPRNRQSLNKNLSSEGIKMESSPNNHKLAVSTPKYKGSQKHQATSNKQQKGLNPYLSLSIEPSNYSKNKIRRGSTERESTKSEPGQRPLNSFIWPSSQTPESSSSKEPADPWWSSSSEERNPFQSQYPPSPSYYQEDDSDYQYNSPSFSEEQERPLHPQYTSSSSFPREPKPSQSQNRRPQSAAVSFIISDDFGLFRPLNKGDGWYDESGKAVFNNKDDSPYARRTKRNSDVNKYLGKVKDIFNYSMDKARND